MQDCTVSKETSMPASSAHLDALLVDVEHHHLNVWAVESNHAHGGPAQAGSKTKQD
jgi:hypothetical protein